MTPGYDMERLKVACEECLKAVSAVLQHEGARKQNVRWRFEHLQLELHSFRIAMWPDLPTTKKQNQREKI